MLKPSPLDYMVALNPVHNLPQSAASSSHHPNASTSTAPALFSPQGTSSTASVDGALLRVLPPFPQQQQRQSVGGGVSKMDSEEGVGHLSITEMEEGHFRNRVLTQSRNWAAEAWEEKAESGSEEERGRRE